MSSSSTPPPWLPNYLWQLESLRNLVRAGHAYEQDLRLWSPIQGRSWDLEGIALGKDAIANVMNSARQLDLLLFPLRLPATATSLNEVRLLNGGRMPKALLEDAQEVARLRKKVLRDQDSIVRYTFAGFLKDRAEIIRHVTESEAMLHIPGPLGGAVKLVMECHNELLRHYGWENCVVNGKWKLCPWAWPNVPAVPPQKVEKLGRAVSRLDELVESEIARVSLVPQEPTPLDSPDSPKEKETSPSPEKDPREKDQRPAETTDATLAPGSLGSPDLPSPPAGTETRPSPEGPPADGTIEKGLIWVKGKTLRLTHGLRELLSYLLKHPGAAEDDVRHHCGYSETSHLHKRLNDLRKKLKVEQKKVGIRVTIKSVETCLYCEVREI
jgi:hypothetical protein